MEIKTYQRLDVLPHLPTMNKWVAHHFKQPPWSYEPPKGQLVGPGDTVYINEKDSVVIFAEQNGQIQAMATGIVLDSIFLNINYFPCDVGALFAERGMEPKNVFYIGCFLTSPQIRKNAELILPIYEKILEFAKQFGRKKIAYMDLLVNGGHTSLEPWIDIIGGFEKTGIVINDPWTTYGEHGQIKVENHKLAFFLKKI